MGELGVASSFTMVAQGLGMTTTPAPASLIAAQHCGSIGQEGHKNRITVMLQIRKEAEKIGNEKVD